MGFYLLHESMLDSILFARDNFLSEEGRLFPSEARIYACPCSVTEMWREDITFWHNVEGYNMRAVASRALRDKQRKPEVCVLRAQDLLATPICIKTINLRWMDQSEVAQFVEKSFVSISRAGKYQGIGLWFECDFDGTDYDANGEQMGQLVTLSTSPQCEATHWKQTVIMLPTTPSGSNENKRSENSEGKSMENGKEDMQELNGVIENKEENKLNNDDRQALNENSENKSEGSDISENKVNKKCTSSETSEEYEINKSTLKSIEVEEDEIVGWSLGFCQSAENPRHYTIVLELLDPEEEEHPEPCHCGMAQCLIIAKFIEKELSGEGFEIVERSWRAIHT